MRTRAVNSTHHILWTYGSTVAEFLRRWGRQQRCLHARQVLHLVKAATDPGMHPAAGPAFTSRATQAPAYFAAQEDAYLQVCVVTVQFGRSASSSNIFSLLFHAILERDGFQCLHFFNGASSSRLIQSWNQMWRQNISVVSSVQPGSGGLFLTPYKTGNGSASDPALSVQVRAHTGVRG